MNNIMGHNFPYIIVVVTEKNFYAKKVLQLLLALHYAAAANLGREAVILIKYIYFII